MELECKGNIWLCGLIWGDLFREVVVGKYNNGKLVEVRVLCWNESLILGMVKNMFGYDELDVKKFKSIWDKECFFGKLYEVGFMLQECCSYFNVLWFFEVIYGMQVYFIFKVCVGNVDKVWESFKEEKLIKFMIMEYYFLVQVLIVY